MAAEGVVEQVADHLEEAAVVTRQIDSRAIGFFIGGMGFGLAVGLVFGYRFNREKIKAEAFKASEAEVEKIRTFYQQRDAARQERHEKPSVEELVEERGYSIAGPGVQAEVDERERPLPPPVPILESPAGHVHKARRTEEAEKSKHDGWDYAEELSMRSPDKPYIIHQDEFSTNESGFNQTTYEYYVVDGVLADEHDQVIEHVDMLVGEANLERWGHGSDDFNVLYIRNSRLELEFEICRNHSSYEEDVLGLERSEE